MHVQVSGANQACDTIKKAIMPNIAAKHRQDFAPCDDRVFE
jgi:hypothetical protein